MTTPYDPFIKFQIAFWEGWIRFATDSCQAYGRVIEHHNKILEQHGCFRFHNVIPQGADWFDHYGKRNHDIDVEKV